MWFEGEPSEDEEPPTARGNRWYFFVPIGLLAIWLLVTSAKLLVFELVPALATTVDLSSGVARVLFEELDWLGVLGWLLLIPLHLVVVSQKRASAWWALGAFCCGLNLLLYIALLLLPARRPSMLNFEPARPPRFGVEKLRNRSTALLQNSFLCESCDSLLNYGVSECYECGQRYRYSDGKPVIDE